MIFITRKFTCFCDKCKNFEFAYQCDECHKIVVYSKNDFIKVLRKKGWTLGKIHLCPNCSREKKKEEEKYDK